MKTENQVQPTRYVCPDCGWTLKARSRRIRCRKCGSLNLERTLPDGRLIKADADETDPRNAYLIHMPDEDKRAEEYVVHAIAGSVESFLNHRKSEYIQVLGAVTVSTMQRLLKFELHELLDAVESDLRAEIDKCKLF